MIKNVLRFAAAGCFFTTLIITASIRPAVSAVPTTGLVAQTTSGASSGSLIEYPQPEEQIEEKRPWITVNLPTEPPVIMNTVRLYVNGTDKTSEANVTNTLLYWQPSQNLQDGRNFIRITYNAGEITTDAAGAPVEGQVQPAIEWSFYIVAKGAEAPPRPKAAPGVKAPAAPVKPKFSGKLTVANAQTFVSTPDPFNAMRPGNLQWPEGSLQEYDVRYRYQFGKKAVDGAITRSYEPLRLRSADSFNIRYIDGTNIKQIGARSVAPTYQFGDIPLAPNEFTPLTISGVKLRGVFYKEAFGDNVFRFASGRTQEPHDLRLKRMSTAFQWKAPLFNRNLDKDIVSLTFVKSTAISKPDSDYVLPRNTLISFQNIAQLSKAFAIDAEMVYSDRELEGIEDTDAVQTLGLTLPSASVSGVSVTQGHMDQGVDFGASVQSSYNHRNGLIYLAHNYRTYGPRFNPTQQGTFSEKDREGNLYTLNFKPTKTFTARTSYDDYHNNLHGYNPYFTNSTKVGRSTFTYAARLGLNVQHMYNKTYTDSDNFKNLPVSGAAEDFENTVKSTTYTYNAPDFGPFNSSVLALRNDDYALYNKTWSQAAAAVGTRDFSHAVSQTNGADWSFRTRYKGAWGASYKSNRTENDAFTALGYRDVTGDGQADFQGTETLKVITKSSTVTDQYGFNYDVIPFKLTSIFNYQRIARNSAALSLRVDNLCDDSYIYCPINPITNLPDPYDLNDPQSAVFDPATVTASNFSKSNAVEKVYGTTWVWILNQEKKLRFDYEIRDNFQQDTSKNSNKRTYDERYLKLTYEKDF